MNYDLNYDILVYRLLTAYLVAQNHDERPIALPIRIIDIKYVAATDKFLIEFKTAKGIYGYVTL